MSVILFLLGLAIVYVSLVFRYVPPPFKWVIEINIPWQKTKKIEWDGGIHFLWFPVKPFMFVRNKIATNDENIILMLGFDEGDGGKGKIELSNGKVSVQAQLVIRVIDVISATYAIDDYRSATINFVESVIRECLGGKDVDDAIKEDAKKLVKTSVEEDTRIRLSGWGVKLILIDVIDFDLDAETDAKRREILFAQKDTQRAKIVADGVIATAEGEKQAAIKKAEGAKQSTILDGEGRKQATILAAEAKKEADILDGTGQGSKIKEIAKTVGLEPVQVIAYLVSGNYFASLEKATIIATSEGGKLNSPVDIGAAIIGLTSAMGKRGSTT